MINVVITTKSVMKCIFLNFGAIPKRMAKITKLNSQKLKLLCRLHIKFIYKNKIKLFTEKTKLKISTTFSSSSSCPTPHSPCPLLSSPLLPSMWFDISYKIFKAYIWQRNILNSLRDHLFDTRWQKWCILNSSLGTIFLVQRYESQCILNSSLRDCLFDTTLQKPMHSELLLKGLSLIDLHFRNILTTWLPLGGGVGWTPTSPSGPPPPL